MTVRRRESRVCLSENLPMFFPHWPLKKWWGLAPPPPLLRVGGGGGAKAPSAPPPRLRHPWADISLTTGVRERFFGWFFFIQWQIQGCVCDRDDPPPLELVPILKTYCKVFVTGTDHPPPPGMWMTSHRQCPRGWWCL